MSTLQDRFVSSLAEIESWAAENLLNSDSKLLSQLQLSVGLAYAISNATPSRLTYIYTYIHTYIIHTYVHIYTYIHTYIHTYIYTYTYICAYIYIHSFIHIYIHTYIHTYTHTYIGDDSTMAFSTNNELLLLLRSHSSLIMDKLSHLFRPDLSVLHTAVCLTKKPYCFFHTDTRGSIPMHFDN
jgi:hypothetical protein